MPGGNFQCPKCKEYFRDNCNLRQHLERKKPCVPFGNSDQIFLGCSYLKSVTSIQDIRRPQVYFGFAGLNDTWEDVKRTDGSSFRPRPDQQILKFGQHDFNTGRYITHHREFGVWQVIDSICTDNPVRLERCLKDFLRNQNELLSALHINKTSRDTELVAVNTQDFRIIVEKAIELAAEFDKKMDLEIERELTKRQEAEADARRAEAETRKAEARIAEANAPVRLLELQIQLKQLQLSTDKI